MKNPEPERLPDQQQLAHQKAVGFRDLLVAWAENHTHDKTAFYPELFRLAAERIEKDVDAFCDRASAIFDEIDAFGQEPTLDDDWLDELTGQKDCFYFSTDALLSELPPLPGKKRGRKPQPPSEIEVVQAVQRAVEKAEDALAVAHHENPNDWIHRIHKALENNQGTATFAQLQNDTGLSPGALFLGLLLGHENWQMRQTQFYGPVIVVLTQVTQGQGQ